MPQSAEPGNCLIKKSTLSIFLFWYLLVLFLQYFQRTLFFENPNPLDPLLGTIAAPKVAGR